MKVALESTTFIEEFNDYLELMRGAIDTWNKLLTTKRQELNICKSRFFRNGVEIVSRQKEIDLRQAELARFTRELRAVETFGPDLILATPESPYKLSPLILYYLDQSHDEYTKKYKPKEGMFFWLIIERVYSVTGIGIPQDVQVKLVQQAYNDELRAFERIRNQTQAVTGNERQPIPESVRIEVWRRDQGKCVRCGSRNKLEYDHIIPVSLGGGNTARNIELLCEACNRAKGANVA